MSHAAEETDPDRDPAHEPVISSRVNENSTSSDDPGPTIVLIAGLACAGVSALACALFLPSQSLWLDEIAQLAGLSLGPLEVVGWLAGWTSHDFLVPTDRMPPLSYWLGWLWAWVFGLRELPLRWLGVCCTALAAFIVFRTARDAWGMRSGVAAGLLFALSPNVITMAVEIRAYPMFLLASAATLWCLVRVLDPGGRRDGWLFGLVISGLLAIYTHFFGLALVGSCLLAALIVMVARGDRLGRLLAAAAVTGIASVAVLPFVMAALKLGALDGSGAPAVSAITKVTDLVKLLYRLFAAPPMSLSTMAQAAAVLGAGTGTIAGLAPKQRGDDALRGMLLTLMIGLAVVFGARFVVKIDSLAPRYNLWMVPAFLLLISSGLAAQKRAFRNLACVAVVLLTAASVYSTWVLADHGESFAHNPHRQIEAEILGLGVGVDRVAVIHEGREWNYDLYISLRHALGPDLRQYIHEPGDPRAMLVQSLPEKSRPLALEELKRDVIIVISSRAVKAWEIVKFIQRGDSPLAEGPLEHALAASREWSEAKQKTFVSFVAGRISVFKRATSPEYRGPTDRSNRPGSVLVP
jgi:hypothetical protein